MFAKVLIANRGEIACRIIRTLKKMKIASVAVYSHADAGSLHVMMADEAICIGEAPAKESYLDAEKIIRAAKESGAEAIHPGYGFLSENASFARRCAQEGIVFIGPTPLHMEEFGLKHTARAMAKAQNVPLLPGTELLESVEEALNAAEAIGYPVMLKSTAGGGGIGMQLCGSAEELQNGFDSVGRLSKSNFSQGGIYLEKFVASARHIEVQIFGDGKGEVIALGERDCSLQRRNQKVIEETPAPGLSEAIRDALRGAALNLARSASYKSAGTVEFVYDTVEAKFYFLEVNTRLQVEHGITEEIYGVDLVEWMILEASGELGETLNQQFEPHGHSIQVRVYAEDPLKNFQPSSGVLSEVVLPDGVRCETWIERGSVISPYYDPMIAKLIVHASTRDEAIASMRSALRKTTLYGIVTNLGYLEFVLGQEVFARGEQTTKYLGSLAYAPKIVEVIKPGTHTTVQSAPGRIGYWDIGVPPSGPMDALSFRLGNRLLGNDEKAPGLEMTVTGATLKFHYPTRIVLSGAAMKAQLNGTEVAYWETIPVLAGDVLKMGMIEGAGARTYLLIDGGFNVPEYLGSTATFTLGEFGGHAGRILQIGDQLSSHPSDTLKTPAVLDAALRPQLSKGWSIGVMYGPHGAPDFFMEEYIRTFFETDWEVHYNSNRTGIRLIGPKPLWAREDGGEAGLHPSNLHDNAYAIGAVDFTGDMPVILGPDGPSLGGFVCPVTIIGAELWKMGQLGPKDRVRFVPVAYADAVLMEQELEEKIATLEGALPSISPSAIVDPVALEIAANDRHDAVKIRLSGDHNVLIEFGPMELDLTLRFQVHELMRRLKTAEDTRLIDLTPGIRSLQVHYDSLKLPLSELLDRIQTQLSEMPATRDIVVPSRTVYLPLSWDDPATKLAIEKYMQSVRNDAPWCPSNIEFIRRMNGLESISDVQNILFEAEYLVMGLGDVYLGAPVAVPVDPRHRLVTTKYNPARTWTPENAVGIGGTYMCVYGMEGPGGYQFVGRTVQMWNRYKSTQDFKPGKPWLLEFFDRIRFYPVTQEELARMRQEFIHGTFSLTIEEGEFSLSEYLSFLEHNSEEIAAFKKVQQESFKDERERWAASGISAYVSETLETNDESDFAEIPAGCEAISSFLSGNVWEISVKVGDRVAEGDTLVVIEAMKSEVMIESPVAGEVVQILCSQGDTVHTGNTLVIIKTEGV
ncbi:MAG: urea carboxylase [Sulfuricurvum sp.]|jgi:urea carboxylase|uniref:urea carboxylase n=1 Tax=Sulfuricurvum sp. TaxID=2025608 RepID=UPI0025F68078|nr:urea carboxylase [Sulfuricurvum sp.]MCK9372067.1 urea carboxylase [Sulfuricurvum sp.]